MINKKQFGFLVVLQLFWMFSASAFAKQPNIILITADDLGFDDLSIHQNPFVTTPNIDRLAKQSVTFSDFSVSPVCSTTRASLLTGRQFYKTGVSGVHGGRDYLNKDEVLISEMLSNNGYKTGFWGKWHSGKSKGYFAWERGFDQGYYAELYQHQNSFGFFDGNPVSHQKWVSEVIVDYAIDFITESTQENAPFFAYLSFLAPHEPWLAPAEFVEPYLKQGQRPAIANLYGMVTEMDFHIGRLLQFIDKSQLSDDTIIIFMSDNGPWWDSSNYGSMTKQEWQQRNPNKLRGNKGQSWQNGIKSPLFIHNKRLFKAANVDRFVNVTDLVPTILELTKTNKGTHTKPFDGESFVPYLLGDTGGPNLREYYIASHDVMSDKPLFNQWTPIDAHAKHKMTFESQRIGLRTEEYKILLNPAVDREHHPKAINNYALFNIQNDPTESNNIIDKKPKLAAQLKRKLNAMFDSIKSDSQSFKPPEYEIDHNASVSVINAFAPASTFGNTLSTAHMLKGLKAEGDGASYHLNAINSGKYKIYIEQVNTDGAGIKLELVLEQQTLETELDGSLNQYIGDIDVEHGTRSLLMKVVGNNSIKPWSEITGLRRLYLIPYESKLKPNGFKLPN